MPRRLATDNDIEPAVPGYRNFLVYCDESGMHGAAYYGFGSLWIPWERRGDLVGLVSRLKTKHRHHGEIKWERVTKRTQRLYEDLIAQFFRRRWMMFHCLVVRRGYVNRSFHPGGLDEAQQKHFAELLRNKIAYFSAGSQSKLYRIRVDPLPYRYQRADEVAHKIINAQLKAEIGAELVHDVVACDSQGTVGIQLADLLLGAVMSAWQGDATAQAKLQVRESVAQHLGWPDLRADTQRHEWKFNVWYFHDPTTGRKREAKTREVELRYSMPPFERRKRN